MPVRRSTDDDKAAPSLLTALFWVGVGLAPLAAIILLVADTNAPLRIAAVLGLTSVVLIGLSIALRPDSGPPDPGIEDRLLDEIEALRHELRSGLAALPAPAGPRAAGRAGPPPARGVPSTGAVGMAGAEPVPTASAAVRVAGPSAPPTAVRRTETVHVSARRTVPDPEPVDSRSVGRAAARSRGVGR
ncbi:hypothetical protein [Micromonospora echinofusca]|uniref:Uncharacterized protein n=1 Tax=Micromonospora echinofusca TaxID=47858 RepID=A0ABS3VV24_MICEH|nr:hypothetical protein [Micromonospora echinofusca]